MKKAITICVRLLFLIIMSGALFMISIVCAVITGLVIACSFGFVLTNRDFTLTEPTK